MRIAAVPHRWNVAPRRAVDIQRTLAGRVIKRGSLRQLRYVAGGDLAFSPDGSHCIAGVVVWDVRERVVVEERVATRPLRFPYVPGLLSFREVPALLAALRRIKCHPDAFMFDGQGLAHPRRFGLACHAGVILDRPSLGCAKSRLVGVFDEPGETAGTYARLTLEREDIGAVVRTRTGVKPVFVSIGHRLSLRESIRVVLACVTRYRLPEPTRLADRLVARERSAAG